RSPRRPATAALGLAAATFLVLALPGLALGQDAEAAAPAAAVGPSENKVVFIIQSVGWLFGLLLLACSVWLIALCVLQFLDLRANSAIPVGFVDEFTDVVNKRKFKEAYDMARNDPSFLGRVLTAGMARLQY